MLKPPAMRLTDRDKLIMEAIHAYDGMMSFSQIHHKFFSCKSQAELRLKLLYQNKYLNRPNWEQRRRLNEMIYWLDKNGAEVVASLNGINFHDFTWRKEPRWFQIEHDLAVNDFRITIEEACQMNKKIILESWIPESEFWMYPDRISYTFGEHQIKRFIRPDGFFMLTGNGSRFRFLLEIDRSTEDNPRFLRDKILPGIAYIKTKIYEERFGHRSGRWLVVTTGPRRMKNMLRQAHHGNDKGLFYFTTFDQISDKTILTSPIWERSDLSHPVNLLYTEQ